MPEASSAALAAQLPLALHERGLKVTPQRQLLFRLLHDNRSHPTAEGLFAEARASMPGISLRTVYHTLNDLVAMLEDPSPVVQRAACLALGALGDQKSLDALASVLLHAGEVSASLDVNWRTPVRLRISSDSRYQRASEVKTEVEAIARATIACTAASASGSMAASSLTSGPTPCCKPGPPFFILQLRPLSLTPARALPTALFIVSRSATGTLPAPLP